MCYCSRDQKERRVPWAHEVIQVLKVRKDHKVTLEMKVMEDPRVSLDQLVHLALP